MGIGVSVFLIALGAVLTFALRDQQVGALDLNAVGWILIAAGIIGLVVTLMIWGGRRRTVVASEPTVTERVAEPSTRYRRVEERTDAAPPEVR